MVKKQEIDGPNGQNMHKDQRKKDQKAETTDYKEVHAGVTKLDKEGTRRKHDLDHPEALRKICRAAFTHNKEIDISPGYLALIDISEPTTPRRIP